jgi:hypothetical protein
MSQFIDQGNLWFATQDSVHVHFFDDNASMLLKKSGDDLQALDEFRCLHATVRFHQSHDHIDTILFEPVALLEHLIGLANTRGITEIDLQSPALRLANHA